MRINASRIIVAGGGFAGREAVRVLEPRHRPICHRAVPPTESRAA